MNDMSHDYLVITTSFLWLLAFFMALVAFHDVNKNGLAILHISWPKKIVALACIISIIWNPLASMGKVMGSNNYHVIRECGQMFVAIGVIGISFMIIRSASVVNVDLRQVVKAKKEKTGNILCCNGPRCETISHAETIKNTLNYPSPV